MAAITCEEDSVECVSNVTESNVTFFSNLNASIIADYETFRISQSHHMSRLLQITYIVAFVVIATVAVCSNSILVAVVATQRRMRTVVNYFLVNVAVADILYIVLCSLFEFTAMQRSSWNFGEGYCRFVIFFTSCALSVKVFTMVAIAFDRFNMTFYPQPKMGGAAIVAVIASTWILSVIFAFPLWLHASTYSLRTSGDTKCYVRWPRESGFLNAHLYDLLLRVIQFFAPVVILFIAYLMVGIQLRSNSRTLKAEQQTAGHEETNSFKRKVFQMLVVMFVIFAICWLPQQVFHLIAAFNGNIGGNRFIRHAFMIVNLLAKSNSMYNPSVFWWFMSDRNVCCKALRSKQADEKRSRNAESVAMVNVSDDHKPVVGHQSVL